MNFPYTNVTEFVKDPVKDSIFLEIGSSRGQDGDSTEWLAEFAQTFDIPLYSIDVRPNLDQSIKHPNVKLQQAVGSIWCKKVLPSLGKQISLVYLDNFDIIWDIQMLSDSFESSEWNKKIYHDITGSNWPEEFTPWHLMPEHLQQECKNIFNKQGRDLKAFLELRESVEVYKKDYGLELNNNNCQVEHLAQLLYIEPYLSSNSVVIFDDTFTINDCWYGKCGPGVVFLQCKGFRVAHTSGNGVIMMRD